MSQTKAQLIDNLVQPITGALGSASAPTFSFTIDPNTGIYSPGADQLALSTGGTGRLFVDASGRILVGNSATTSVAGFNGFLQLQGTNFDTATVALTNVAANNTGSYLLLGKARGGTLGGYTSVNNGDNLGQIRFMGADGTGYVEAAYIGVTCNGVPGTNNMPGRLFFSTNSGTSSVTERMCITPSGLVGVGTSSPGSRLTVNRVNFADASATGATTLNNAGITVEAATDTNNRLMFGIGSTGGAPWIQAQNTSSNATQSLILNPVGGSVGIGTSSPASTLHSVGTTILGTGTYPTGSIGLSDARTAILSSTENQILIIGNTNATVGADKGAEIYLGAKATTGSENLAFAKIGGYKSNATSGNFESHLAFSTSNSVGTSSEKVRIDSSGRVGIGNTSPALKLHVEDSGSQVVRWTRTGVGAGSLDVDASGNAVVNAHTSSTGIAFHLQASEKARLDSSGRFLVGTSSARTAWDNTAIGSNLLQVERAIDGGNTSISICANAGTSSPTDTGAFLYLGKTRGTTVGSTTAVASTDCLGRVSFQGSDGTEQVEAARVEAFVDGTPGANNMPGRIVLSTTAVGAGSPTERMRIDSTGYLIKYGDTNTARIVPQTDNAGYVGMSTKRWEAIYAVNGTIQTSDEREKTDIVDSPLGADFIRTLRPVAYKWKIGGYTSTYDDDGKETITPNPGVRTHYGFIAQEVKQAVGETDFGGWLQEDLADPDSKQSLRLHEFISPIVKALQEALAEIDNLKAEVAALKAQ